MLAERIEVENIYVVCGYTDIRLRKTPSNIDSSYTTRTKNRVKSDVRGGRQTG